MSNTIKIIDKNSREELFEFPMESQKEAHEMAVKLESMNIAVEMIIPSVLEQLADNLGADKKQLSRELDQEIDSH
ncbi:MAG: hypothetical protein OXB84_01405 [Halobacteriovoraceae bacterium]|nr:hypothetical protein [Halobacteriovoraceae bacterium]